MLPLHNSARKIWATQRFLNLTLIHPTLILLIQLISIQFGKKTNFPVSSGEERQRKIAEEENVTMDSISIVKCGVRKERSNSKLK